LERLSGMGWLERGEEAGGGFGRLFEPPPGWEAWPQPRRSLLEFGEGSRVERREDWGRRRAEILEDWKRHLGEPPPLLDEPRVEIVAEERRENFRQLRVRVETARGRMSEGYLLVPDGEGKRPGVVVPYYEAETSIGRGRAGLRDFGYELARRGFVTLSIGSPGGDARRPPMEGVECQPLLYLGSMAANAGRALGRMSEVDARRIGVVGHSYGGKWAMFAAAFYDEVFATGVWSDPGIMFDEGRPNVNYWEHWYLGHEFGGVELRRAGLPSLENPRRGAYARLVEGGHDLHEVQALLVPRPFLVSGGAEDPPERWGALGEIRGLYSIFGVEHGVAMTNRAGHDPTFESNEEIYLFLEGVLLRGTGALQKVGGDGMEK
jgi:hypothetical protein